MSRMSGRLRTRSGSTSKLRRQDEEEGRCHGGALPLRVDLTRAVIAGKLTEQTEDLFPETRFLENHQNALR
jgi:hypothetical protein